jgi:3-hydroxyacyl-[acyl-carrier-protein] dehydratase
MSLRNLYVIENLQSSENEVTAVVQINGTHAVFKGHFPEHPVLPGVCMISIVREIAELRYGRKLKLISAANIKFLSILNPLKTEKITALVQCGLTGDDLIEVDARLHTTSVIFFKMKAVFSITGANQ